VVKRVRRAKVAQDERYGLLAWRGLGRREREREGGGVRGGRARLVVSYVSKSKADRKKNHRLFSGSIATGSICRRVCNNVAKQKVISIDVDFNSVSIATEASPSTCGKETSFSFLIYLSLLFVSLASPSSLP
jgi:hypothetical protein